MSEAPSPSGSRSELRVHAVSLAWLFAIGSTLVMLTVALYQSDEQDELGLMLLAGGGYAAAILLRLGYRWMREWAYQLFVLLGTVLITVGIYFSGDGASGFAAFYIWVSVYSFYFFSRRRAVAQLAAVAVAYGLVLALGPESSAPVVRWLLTVGTLGVAGGLIANLVDAVRERASDAAARAARLQLAEEQTRHHAEDLERIARVARDLSGVTDAHAARPAICTAARELAGAKIAILYEPDARGRELVSTAVVGAKVEQIHLPFTGQPSGAGTAFSSGEPHFISDVASHPGVAHGVREELEVASGLWQPVLRNGVPIGVLAVGWAERIHAPSDRVRSLVGLLAAEAAVAIERADLLARLEAVARTDDLTGLANRRAWDEHLPRELSRAQREERPLCVAMLDLDRFKAFNDERGHQAGDRLLKEVAATWREMLRPSDLLARYGGEEFGLVLPNCALEKGLEVVERLRGVMIAEQTCSAGVAEWDGDEAPESLVSRADAALYEAKKAGRDRALPAG